MNSYARVLRHYLDLKSIKASLSLMGWDQQVLMPAGGANARAEHMALLTRLHYEILTGDELGTDLDKATREVEPGTIETLQLRELSKERGELMRLPSALVQRKSRVTAAAYEVWRTAKPSNNFAMLVPYLAEIYEIVREESSCLDPNAKHPYDPLIDLYEEGAKTSTAEEMFGAIKEPIINLVREIREHGSAIDDTPLTRDWDQNALRNFAQEAAAKIGFDFDRGNLSLCRNAFCTSLSQADIRMTTRPSDHFKGVISSSFHEMGHALYEQNIDPAYEFTPLAGGTSLAVHESQSRLWENIIGRSLPFWQCLTPMLHKHYPALAEFDDNSIFRMLANVNPIFVRVGADELTYNLHILVRFELEVALLTKQIEINDLPEAWNQKYADYLGIRPSTDTDGCLQDVHWTRGSIGYFPTYSMGNLIGAQIWKCLQRDLVDTDSLVAAGDFGPILGWLKENIYQHGKRFSPTELVTRVTGRPMEATDWLQYATTKYRALYGL